VAFYPPSLGSAGGGGGGGENSGSGLVQPGAFYLLHSGNSEDALQSSAYLVSIVSEGCR
jgi:hypothetical protein